MPLRFEDYGLLLADFGGPEYLLVVEIDGYAFHNSEAVLERDKQRQNALVHGGWKVLRYTPRDLRLRPEAVVQEIRDVLGTAAQLHGAPMLRTLEPTRTATIRTQARQAPCN